jgi:hypothetical protein
VGTGIYWMGPEAFKEIALNGKNGAVLWEAPTQGIPMGSPAVGEIDSSSPGPEIVTMSRGGWLYSWSANGTKRYQTCVSDSPCGSTSATNNGVALADINGDGVVDAITQPEQTLVVANAKTGAIEERDRSAYTKTIFASSSTPTVVNINGKATIFVTSRGDFNNNVAYDDNDELVVQAWQSQSALGAAPWPTFKQNMMRTSNATAPKPRDPVPTQNFVTQAYKDFLNRTPSSDEVNACTSRLMNYQLTRYDLATQLSKSSEWITKVVTSFYHDTLNRDPDPIGLNGWVTAAQGGKPITQIASAFYASDEYFTNIGHSDYRTWVTDLYQKLLLRSPDPAGLDGWVTVLNNGKSRSDVAIGFYQSNEKLGVRITALYASLLGRAPEPGAVHNWTPFVASNGDLVLAAAIAGSDEYMGRAQTPH